jgi:biopolymer transport protein TolQ
MNPTDVMASGLAAPGGELSLWSMFWGAHFVVKVVMLGLIAGSVWCWAIIVDKTLLYRRTRKAMEDLARVAHGLSDEARNLDASSQRFAHELEITDG